MIFQRNMPIILRLMILFLTQILAGLAYGLVACIMGWLHPKTILTLENFTIPSLCVNLAFHLIFYLCHLKHK